MLDWTTRVEFSEHITLGIREWNIHYYDASAGSTASLQNFVCGKIKLKGMFIDTIVDIVNVNDLAAMLSVCQNIAEVDTNTKYLCYKLTAFWHVLCGKLIWAGTSEEYKLCKIGASKIHLYLRWQMIIDSNRRPDLTEKDLATFHLSHITVTELRKFFGTSKGYIGWAPENSQHGDSVVFFSGGRLPYMLRVTKFDTRNQGSRYFEFIMDAYIHAAMKGELYSPTMLANFSLI